MKLTRLRIDRAWLGVPLLAAWRLLDWLLPKRTGQWAFFGHPLKPDQLIENARAVFEQVGEDPSILRIVFVRGGHIAGLDSGSNVRQLELASLAGLWTLARCGVLLLTNSTQMDLSIRWTNGGYAAPRPALRRRVVVNLWHGIPLKRLFALANPEQRRHGDRNRVRRLERRDYAGLIASSDVDAHAMAAIFHPLPPERVWVTGLPRNDFLRMSEDRLPTDQRGQLAQLRQLRRGRRLVLYAPTYRDASVATSPCYRFDDTEVDALKALLRRHDAVLGMRSHYLRNGAVPCDPQRHLDNETLFDLGHDHFHEIAPLLRESAIVVTDYSSVYIDALYLERPVLGFAYDLEHYRARQNGLLYDMALAFPGPVTTDFNDFLDTLDRMLEPGSTQVDPRYGQVRRMFFRHDDCGNAQRVVDRIKDVIASRTAR